jgi:hypothetical protein
MRLPYPFLCPPGLKPPHAPNFFLERKIPASSPTSPVVPVALSATSLSRPPSVDSPPLRSSCAEILVRRATGARSASSYSRRRRQKELRWHTASTSSGHPAPGHGSRERRPLSTGHRRGPSAGGGSSTASDLQFNPVCACSCTVRAC